MSEQRKSIGRATMVPAAGDYVNRGSASSNIVEAAARGASKGLAKYAASLEGMSLEQLEQAERDLQDRIAQLRFAARMATPPQPCVVCELVVAPEDRAPGEDGRPFYERFHAACRAATWCSTCGDKLTIETDSDGRPWCGCG